MGIITVPRVTFIAGDARPDLLATLQAPYRLRPLYGPEDAYGQRALIGAIAEDLVELFAATVAVADAAVDIHPKDRV